MESWRAAPGVFWTFVLPGGLWLAVFFLVPLALVWLIAVETRWFAGELKSSTLRGFGQALWMFAQWSVLFILIAFAFS